MKKMYVVYSDEKNLTAQAIESAIKQSLPPGHDQIKVIEEKGEQAQALRDISRQNLNEELTRLIVRGYHIDSVVDGERPHIVTVIFHEAFPGREVDFKPSKPSGEFGMRRFQ